MAYLFVLIYRVTAQAIILYSGDNNTNLNAPDTPRNTIFDSVAKISNENGTGIIGSAVYVKRQIPTTRSTCAL